MILILLFQIVMSLGLVVFIIVSKYKMNNFNQNKPAPVNLLLLTILNFVTTLLLGFVLALLKENMDFLSAFGITFYAGLFSFVSALSIPYFGYQLICGLEISTSAKMKLGLVLGVATSLVASITVALMSFELFSVAALFCVAGIISTPGNLYFALKKEYKNDSNSIL